MVTYVPNELNQQEEIMSTDFSSFKIEKCWSRIITYTVNFISSVTLQRMWDSAKRDIECDQLRY